MCFPVNTAKFLRTAFLTGGCFCRAYESIHSSNTKHHFCFVNTTLTLLDSRRLFQSSNLMVMLSQSSAYNISQGQTVLNFRERAFVISTRGFNTEPSSTPAVTLNSSLQSVQIMKYSSIWYILPNNIAYKSLTIHTSVPIFRLVFHRKEFYKRLFKICRGKPQIIFHCSITLWS